MGTDITDSVGMKRWLAFLEGGLLPIISLTSLHFFVKYEDPNSPKKEEKELNIEEKEEVDSTKVEEESPKSSEDVIEDVNDDKVERLVNLQKEADRVWEKVNELRENGQLPIQEELEDEPTALANSEYSEGLDEEDDDEQPVLVEEENPEDELLFPITGNTETNNIESQEINVQKTLDVIDNLKEVSNKIVYYSTAELWNNTTGPIHLNDPFCFYKNIYTDSKRIVSEILRDKEKYSNIFITSQVAGDYNKLRETIDSIITYAPDSELAVYVNSEAKKNIQFFTSKNIKVEEILLNGRV
jgi:membrane-associated HD superfamily phosphohydrolase